MFDLPDKQYAVQLVGPDELVLNRSKEVPVPGPWQILCRVEAIGLCFSDLKLLKHFTGHPRKSQVTAGIDSDILSEIPSYVPGGKATVPGHEAVVTIAAAGSKVKDYKAGQRYLVQTDYRWLSTKNSNAAFGYNFEGALQEYVLMDLRVIISPEGESMLIPVPDALGNSAVALVEPWACVEDAYATSERKQIKQGGRTLIVADEQIDENKIYELFDKHGRPGKVTWICDYPAPAKLSLPVDAAGSAGEVPDFQYDDVFYFGGNCQVIEKLFYKLCRHGHLNIALCGRRLDRYVDIPLGLIHYSGIRVGGTPGDNPARVFDYIPDCSEIRESDTINVIGAGGPMGMMHVIRDISQGVKNVSVFAGDISNERLANLSRIAGPLSEQRQVHYATYNPKVDKSSNLFSYTVVMVPSVALAASSVANGGEGAIINIFAGISKESTGSIDLNRYIEKQMYFTGTSGSTVKDMQTVLSRVEKGLFDTNVSVSAVSGLKGAVEGIRAVENHSIAGKIIVYPACKGMGLIRLDELKDKMPSVAEELDNNLWTKRAEKKLMEYCSKI